MIHTAEALAQAEAEQQKKTLSSRYDRLHELLRHHDAYNVDHRIEQVLDGLGFRPEDYDRPVDTFSGGQQSRLMLAKLLLAAPDVMLLDEPSNHLDIDTTRWLEDYLVKQPEAMLIVSHDRYFLDRVVTKVFEMHANRITSIPAISSNTGGCAQERYEQELKAYEAQKEYIEKQEEYIRRVHYGQLHKQAAVAAEADRQDRTRRTADAGRDAADALRRGAALGRRGVAGGGSDQGVRPAAVQGLELQPAARPAAGHHGAQRQRQDDAVAHPAGRREAGQRQGAARPLVEFGYYDQHLKTLDRDKPVIRAVWPEADPDAVEQGMRNLLGRFGLIGDQVNQRVGELSGGEKSRAALAKLVAAGRQRPGAGRADEPSRPVGVRCAGAGVARCSRARASWSATTAIS